MATTPALLGKPAIPTPGALDLRSVQQTIDNIRERFARLEAAVTLNTKTVSASQAASASDALRLIQALRADVDALVAAASSDADDLAPAPRVPPAPDDDLGPPPVTRAEFVALAGRVEALEME